MKMTGDCCCRSNCNDNGHSARKVLSKKEKITKLENYAQELKKELATVEEHIKDLGTN